MKTAIGSLFLISALSLFAAANRPVGSLTSSNFSTGDYVLGIGANSNAMKVSVAEVNNWTQPYKYLKTCPATPGLVGVPSFYFKASPDGTNWSVISPNQSVNYSNATAGAQCYAPTTIYANGYYWTMYDVFAVVGPSNIFALDKSADLINWTAVGLFTNAPVDHKIWGSEWFTDTDGTIYLVLGTYDGQTGIWITSPQDANMSSFSTATQLTTRKLYDPSIFKHSGKYYLWGSSNGVVQLLTNSTVTGTYNLHTVNVLSNVTSLSLEGAQVIQLGTSNWLMYVQTDPSAVVKMYYTRSTDLVNWSGWWPVRESGTIAGHGSVLELPPVTSVISQRAHLLNTGRENYPLVYELTTASGGTSKSTPVLQYASGSSAMVTAEIIAAGENGQTAYWQLQGLGQADGSPGYSVVSSRTNRMAIPASTWGATIGNAAGGPIVTVTGPSSTVIHWKITLTQDQVQATNAIAIDPTVWAEQGPASVSTIAGAFDTLYTNGTCRAFFNVSTSHDDSSAGDAEIVVYKQDESGTNIYGRAGFGAATAAGGLVLFEHTAFLNPGDVFFLHNINGTGGAALSIVPSSWHLVELCQ